MMKLSNSDLDWILKVENKKDMLGQVFTPQGVANLMVSLGLNTKPRTILEPCFGEGVFLESIQKRKEYVANDTKIIGVEIDPVLYERVRSKFPNLELYNKDFFDFKGVVDCVIMNPPYIRQELLREKMPRFLNKSDIITRLPLLQYPISSRSNLYVYFIIKAWSILSEKGSIIAIIPNTWMAAEYGNSFKKFLLQNFWIKAIIQFNKDVFPDADVESCILYLSKEKDSEFNMRNTYLINIQKPFSKDEFLSFNDLINNVNGRSLVRTVTKEILELKGNWLNLFGQNNLFNIRDNLVPLKEIANLKRGLTTNYNKFFINDTIKFINRYPEYFKAILCSPKEIKGYSTESKIKEQYIFCTEKQKSELPLELKEYVEKYEHEILSSTLPKTLYGKITSNPDNWFNIKLTKTAPILFSYIVREKKKFIFNRNNMIARDNFYEIFPKEHINQYVLFSILNSRITSLSIENIGRSHGKGLLKIQKYELKELEVVNPSKIQKEDLIFLESLGRDLSVCSDENPIQIISKIDKILLPYVSTKYKVSDLEERLKIEENSRLSKRIGHLRIINDGGMET